MKHAHHSVRGSRGQRPRKRRLFLWGGFALISAGALAFGAINFSGTKGESVAIQEQVAVPPTPGDAPRILAPRALVAASLAETSRQKIKPRTFSSHVIAEGLVSPDGMAFHPMTGFLHVSEEDAHAIARIVHGRVERVIDARTPIYRSSESGMEMTSPLRFPEGIAFSPLGDLYVAEDIPGGRLIGFSMDEQGQYSEGVEIEIPGDWSSYAWEGLDVGPSGELLLAGSDLEFISQKGRMSVFSGVILYRDREGTWWMPHRRLFASYSDVRFSKNMKQAVYTCEVTGEIGWLDLNSTFSLGGHSSFTAKGPEGVAILPDGTLIIAEERGSLVHVDPAADRHERIVTGLSTIESVLWDPVQEHLLVTEDGSGRVLAFKPEPGYSSDTDAMLYVRYQAAFSHLNIPKECPGYLARILALGGLDFGNTSAKVTFREFVSRVPLLAADLRATSMHPERQIDDPVERVHFAVFEPNRLSADADGVPSMSLAIFAVRNKSGTMVTTSTLPLVMHTASAPDHVFEAAGSRAIAVPQASAASVSSQGVAAVQFLGYGRTPDYSLLLNPRHPADSYMIVFNADGSRDHYRLDSGGGDPNENWVIAYSSLHHEQWLQLSPKPEELLRQPIATLTEIKP